MRLDLTKQTDAGLIVIALSPYQYNTTATDLIAELANRLEAKMDKPKSDKSLPQATRTSLVYVGRGVYSLEGVPGLYWMKRPRDGKTEAVEGNSGKGKGHAPHTFWRVFELEERLAGWLRGTDHNEEIEQ